MSLQNSSMKERSSTLNQAISRNVLSRTLAGISLALWCCSLPLVGLVFKSGQEQFTGIDILIRGWFVPSSLGNFAWFANPFFLLAAYRLLSNKAAPVLALLASLLALDTFRFAGYALPLAGSTQAIFGYGWGMVVWFSSLLLLLVAAGNHRTESQKNAIRFWQPPACLIPIGGLSLVMVLAVSGYFAIYDSQHANFVERKRLTDVAFKKGTACELSEPSIIGLPIKLNAPIEIRRTSDSYVTAPFTETELLGWGINTIRYRGRDFSYVIAGNQKVLTSVPAVGSTSAVLTVSDSGAGHPRKIAITLQEKPSDRMVIDERWIEESDHSTYCPTYSFSYSQKDRDQPRKVLMEALGIGPKTNDSPSRSDGSRQPETMRVKAILANSEGWDAPREQEEPNGSGTRKYPAWKGNINCPNGIGWDGTKAGVEPIEPGLAWPFMVGERAYYVGGNGGYNALCVKEYVYLFDGYLHEDFYYLSIEKRALSDFRQVWSGVVLVDRNDIRNGADGLTVRSIDELSNGIVMELRNEKTMKTALVTAALNTKPIDREH
jgi:hypothetical protein